MEIIKANPYFLGLATAIAIYISLFLLKTILFKQVDKIVQRKRNRLDDVLIYTLAHTTHLFMLVTALYLGFLLLPEHKVYPTWSWRIFFIALMFQVAVWGSYIIHKWMTVSFVRKRLKDPASASSISIVELIAKVSLFSIIGLFTLNNIGIQVTTMIAGLGIGGIAVALAMQNILGDLFSSMSIVLDKPFVVGDFIVLGEWLGEVEKIGIKTTRIRSLSGEQIIISNSDLLRARIRNYKRMQERRVTFILPLPHQTRPEELKKAVEIISGVISSKGRIRFERCHFMRVNSTSLDIETVYWVLSDDYDLYMDIQQNILMDIHSLFLKENLPYAYPTQSLYVNSDGLYRSQKIPQTSPHTSDQAMGERPQ